MAGRRNDRAGRADRRKPPEPRTGMFRSRLCLGPAHQCRWSCRQIRPGCAAADHRRPGGSPRHRRRAGRSLNEDRRVIEGDVQEDAEALLAGQHNRAVALLAGQGWHPGVIGIVAGRIKEKTGKPPLSSPLDDMAGQRIGPFDQRRRSGRRHHRRARSGIAGGRRRARHGGRVDDCADKVDALRRLAR